MFEYNVLYHVIYVLFQPAPHNVPMGMGPQLSSEVDAKAYQELQAAWMSNNTAQKDILKY